VDSGAWRERFGKTSPSTLDENIARAHLVLLRAAGVAVAATAGEGELAKTFGQ